MRIYDFSAAPSSVIFTHLTRRATIYRLVDKSTALDKMLYGFVSVNNSRYKNNVMKLTTCYNSHLMREQAK